MIGGNIGVGASGIGPQGLVGSQGANSDAGSQGNAGFPGRVGFQGVQGAVGTQGSQGAQGLSGSQGSQGTQGSQGAQGAAGGPPVAGYWVWYDASDVASITESGGLVSQLADKSGNSIHLTASGVQRPTTGTRTQNGLNVLDFNGTLNGLAATFGSRTTNRTIFAVALSDVGTGGSNIVGMSFGGLYTDAPLVRFAVYAGTAMAGRTIVTSANVHTAIVQAAANDRLYFNGTLDTDGNAGGTTAATAVALGSAVDYGSFWWNGWIAEAIIYESVLSDGDRGSVEAYLKAKWGTP